MLHPDAGPPLTLTSSLHYCIQAEVVGKLFTTASAHATFPDARYPYLGCTVALQAEDLGKLFRTVMYPRYGPAGNGFLRLHSTYRHDLKIYTSDEGRVQTSAAAFTQGLLDLEGTSLTPILVRYGTSVIGDWRLTLFRLEIAPCEAWRFQKP